VTTPLWMLEAARAWWLERNAHVAGRQKTSSPLLGIPADELIDQLVPFDDVWGEASYLAVQLAEAPGPDAALRSLQADLLHR
jgi:hypothetical protein